MDTTTNPASSAAITVRVGNGQVVHAGISYTDDRGTSYATCCGAEGRRYIASRIVKVDAPVSCGRCSDQPAPVSKRTAAVAQTTDQRRAAIEANIARTQESLAMFQGYLAAHPGDAGLLESIARCEARIAQHQADLA